MTTLHAALEIGTTRTVLALGEAQDGGRVKVTCMAGIPSAGVRKSQILDIGQASQSVRSVLQEIERKQAERGSTVTLGNAFLAVSGQHVKADPFVGTVTIAGARVTEDDLRAVADNSRMFSLSKDRELLDIVECDYGIDALGGITSPVGMSGRILRLNTMQIHADRNRLEDARTAAGAAHLEIRETLFSTTCAAEAVLEEHERKNGVLVLDCGGGSTGYAVYCDGHLVSTGVIGVGGDHVTNDIAHAFQTTQAQAEELKRTAVSAVLRNDSDGARVQLPGSSPLMSARTLSRRALDTVVNARLRELFAIVRERLEEQNLAQRLHSGVVLVGGGAALEGMAALAGHELGLDVRIGRPIQVDGLDDHPFPPAAATVAGVLLYAHRNYEEKSFFNGFFGRIFK